MSKINDSPDAPVWRGYEKVLFRLLFIYFLLQVFPLDWKFYRELFSIDWGHLRYGDIFNLAHYSPAFLGAQQTYADWALIAGIAVAGAIVWTFILQDRASDYNKLFYWIRVIVRYRLAVAILAYGFIKLFPVLAPVPSLSNLNTNYGDFTRWKLFSLSLGIVPNYESFLGLVEIVAGILLLYRKTATAGAFITSIFLGNVFMSNIAYEGGEQVYSLYLISLALFIVGFDLRRLASLLIFQIPTLPNRWHPQFREKWQRPARLALKGLFIFFFIFYYGFKTRSGYEAGSYQFPVTPGLKDATGLYNVTEFRINEDSLGYSKTDPRRWQDVVFEKWATISIRSNRPVVLDSTNVEKLTAGEGDKDYELEGSAGRHYYHYEVDSINQVLILRNKNKHYQGETILLHYSRPSPSRIALSGVGPDRDSLYAVLDRVDKKYLLEEAARRGRQTGLKL